MKSIFKFFDNLNPAVIIIANFIFILFLGSIDYLTGTEFSFSIFYLLPISITAWYAGKSAGIFASIVSAIVWFMADITAGHIYTSTLILIWNTIMRLSIFFIFSMLLSSIKSYLHKTYQDELLLQKNKNIIDTAQKITVMISENITEQNSEIIKWLNKKKNKGESVSESVERASQIIGLSLQMLSETTFVHPYTSGSSTDADMYLDLIKNKLSQINKKLSTDVD